MDLFDQAPQNQAQLPLAERLRPQSLDCFIGQNRVVGASGLLSRFLRSKRRLPNLVFWGPPGTGKTTLALLIAQEVDGEFISVNAIDTGAKKLRELGESARQNKLHYQRETILFIDEIHRLNKSQQDVLLPFTERGDFILIGATTENPGYELNSALLSRSQVLVFESHSNEDLRNILRGAYVKLKLTDLNILKPDAEDWLVQTADGDARQLFNLLDQVLQLKEEQDLPLDIDSLKSLLETSPFYYDKSGDEHYNSISAFIKSVRGSDPDAAVYYLARMLDGGEDPKFIARRLLILASEDIGNADPRAITVATSGLQAVEFIGLPEAAITLAQITTYLASCPKSNRSYMSLRRAQQAVREHGHLPIPKALRSDRTRLAKQLGHGKDYKYSHDGPTGWLEQDFLPEKIKNQKFYEPSNRGFEKNIIQYLAWVKNEKSEDQSDKNK